MKCLTESDERLKSQTAQGSRGKKCGESLHGIHRQGDTIFRHSLTFVVTPFRVRFPGVRLLLERLRCVHSVVRLRVGQHDGQCQQDSMQ